jgi:hypothetical protein
MDTTMIVTIVVAVITLLLVGGFLGLAFARRQRTRRLQQLFGPEYERAVKEVGDPIQAEKELDTRLHRVKSMDIQPLSDVQVERFAGAWRSAQAKFVDDPVAALQEADHLIREVMGAKGYLVEDFEQSAADISVDYPDLVPHYRGLYVIAAGGESQDVGTEDMRQALIHCRTLFEKLLGSQVSQDETTNEDAAQKDITQKEKVE